MRYRLRVPDEIADFLRSLHPEIKRKATAVLDIITSDPDAGKSLHDELKGLKSFRIGRFRIIYRVGSKRIIEIVAIGPRKTVYQETYRLLKKTPSNGVPPGGWGTRTPRP
jgi:mRNA interferase RelE/StbE